MTQKGSASLNSIRQPQRRNPTAEVRAWARATNLPSPNRRCLRATSGQLWHGAKDENSHTGRGVHQTGILHSVVSLK